MKRVANILLFLTSSAALSQTLIGRTTPSDPPGFSTQQGSCVSQELGEGHSCDYALSFLETDKGKLVSILGERLVGRATNGKPTYRITDQIPYPDIPQGYMFIYVGCKLDGQFNFTVFGVVRVDPNKQWMDEILWAKRLNLMSGAFEELEPKRVACADESGDQ